MKRFLPVIVLLVGCVGGGTETPPTGGPTTFDGRYPGTIEAVSPSYCGNPGGRITITVSNGNLSMPLSGGRRMTGRVQADGSVRDLRFSGGGVAVVGGSGRIESGQMSVSLETLDPRFSVTCNFRYAATLNAAGS